MKIYKLTAFEQDGNKLLDESFQAENDDAAQEKGRGILEEKGLLEKAHRCTSLAGKLLLFHS
ncbi:YhzD family protein [Bacillus sp. B-jedd]|uniref:YhzD family protein n=1 Tax=Bacillus sp. B-jedd TaxID=1476857 RepID=UPI0005156293|nr:YhzD family protein [Bacillus sp. B-jedd]CEG29646.1 S-layer protein [Bacillus sp. B-jedd]